MNQVNTIFRFSKAIAPSVKMCAIAFFSLFFVSISTAQFVPTEQSIKKVNTLIDATFGADILAIPLEINSNYKSIEIEGEIKGYVCVEQALSKHDKFEFVLIYDDQLNILQVKVLLYREDYGYEIKSKRWLKQFSTRDVRKVQAISGATISVNSLKKSVEHLNQKMKKFIL